MEELYYALERALDEKGDTFPIFALLNGILPEELPPALKSRKCIILENGDWAKQIVSAINETEPGFTPQENLKDFIILEYEIPDGKCLEIKPRFKRISPYRVAVEYKEKESGNVIKGSHGPSGIVPNNLIASHPINSAGTIEDDKRCWVWGADNEINSTNSIYLFYKNRPKRIWVGHPDRLIMYEI